MSRRQLVFPDQFVIPENETERMERMVRYERHAYQQGATAVAGLDEAGRGCLAGPVVAAAVILPRDWLHAEINDSKQLTARQRERLFAVVQEHALSVGVGMASAEIVDQRNVLQATHVAMKDAIAHLSIPPDFLLLDAVKLSKMPMPQYSIIKGDSLSLSIAAASIIAKVTRDRLMQEYEREFPGYGFAVHKGYGTNQHRNAIKQYGPSPIHRKTFRGVKEYLR
ncbi:ribonuclease HII [Candidatus Moduliflexus flocculans]|uniref:Ribonuclease HII n=1 Tax=Candidatus Moduliflexus flocculans TaxID=1499966 RepID=A0A081BQV9_9BACT|nr:ribonuclease HII [Candidatus Moduliflexus flocculans]